MKKIAISFILFIIISLGIIQVFASENDKYELKFTIINNSKNENTDIYILLPKEYIMFAIEKSGLNLAYDGSTTLKQSEITGIEVKKENVQDEVYEENGIEYVQIKLEKNKNGNYLFYILNDYTDMNMKYRIKNENKDYIMHINNFKIINGICEIEYDYDNNSIKQPDKTVIPFGTICLIIILIVVIILGCITYIKQRR